MHAGHIPANDLVAIKAHCLSSLKASTPYFTFLAMKRNGTVVAAPCPCVAGQGEACSHVAATDDLFRRQNKAESRASSC